MSDNCTGGVISSLQVNNTDCSCVSIASITWNPAGTQFTITLNNGQAITSPVLTGATGPAPTISFRVSGTTLQYSINSGTSWVSIYDLSGLISAKVLANQYPGLSTLGTSFESLLVGRTPYVLPLNTLASDGDEITIHAAFSTSSWTSASQFVRLTFNGAALNATVNLGFWANNINKINIDVRLTRTSNTTAKYEMFVSYYQVGLGGSTLVTSNAIYNQNITDIAGLNFTTNNYNIDAQGDSVVIGDVTCNAFEVVYKHKP